MKYPTITNKQLFSTASAVFAAVFVLLFSESVKSGVKYGLSLCADSLIPSLFLFCTAALFAVKCGAVELLGKILSPISAPLFGLSGFETGVWLISSVAGYPVGAKLLSELYEEGRITLARARKMLTFCSGAGPAFIISAVGETVLGSRADGKRLLLILLIANCLSAAAVRFVPDRFFGDEHKAIQKNAHGNVGGNDVTGMFVTSVSEAGKTMLGICFFTIFFSGVTFGISALPFKFAISFTELLEITNGIQKLTRTDIVRAAFLLAFGGISVIFQIATSAENIRPRLSVLTASRLVSGLIASSITVIFERLFPRAIETSTQFGASVKAPIKASPAAMIALGVLCVVLICFTEQTLKAVRWNSAAVCHSFGKQPSLNYPKRYFF